MGHMSGTGEVKPNRKSRDNLPDLGTDSMIIVVLKSMLGYNFLFIWLRILSTPRFVNTIMNSGQIRRLERSERKSVYSRRVKRTGWRGHVTLNAQNGPKLGLPRMWLSITVNGQECGRNRSRVRQ